MRTALRFFLVCTSYLLLASAEVKFLGHFHTAETQLDMVTVGGEAVLPPSARLSLTDLGVGLLGRV